MTSFGLSSHQCETLLAFEQAGSASQLSLAINQDLSVVSRQLQKIAGLAPVFEKEASKWRLTTLGYQLNHWTRESAASQRRILQSKAVVRIGSTRKFAARVLAPQLAKFLDKDIQNTEVHLTTSEDGIERLLLSGDADLDFDCGRPEDSRIKFKILKQETFSVVASPSLIKQYRIRSIESLLLFFHLQYPRASVARLLKLPQEVANIAAPFNDIAAPFNDIAAIREACCVGLGWAVLRTYAVERELNSRQLKALTGTVLESLPYGVW